MDRSELLGSFVKEIKLKRVFGKKYTVSLYVFTNRIEGNGFRLLDNGFNYQPFNISYDNIKDISIRNIEGEQCLTIVYRKEISVSSNDLLPIGIIGLEDINKWKKTVEDAKSKYLTLKDQKRKEREAAIAKRSRESDTFYNNCYNFHIKDNTPTYIFSSDKNEISAMFIAVDRSINFLYINGDTAQESVGTIPFEKMHYFERAGNVSYATDVHGTYTSFGGSMTGDSFSKKAALLGGALFGLMGMTAGALLTHSPTKQQPIDTRFKLDSDIVKIDDRNVILNFYSDEKKQYIDIELPQDTYNFLQTYLPEKKYSVVEEIEKQSVLKKMTFQTAITPTPNAEQLAAVNAPAESKSEDSLDAFKRKVEKLKIMKESGLISDAELEKEKRKLIAEL